jgi:hypothetical protein
MKIKNIIILFLVLISGCASNPFFQVELPKEDKIFAEEYISILLAKDINKAKSFFSNALLETNISWLDTIVYKINTEEIKNRKLVYQKILSTANPYRVILSYELEYSNYWSLTEITLDKNDGGYSIAGLYYFPLNNSFEELTTFKLNGKSLVHYLMLVISIFVPLFILYVLLICIKTELKKKWLWIIFILLGFIKISFNWSLGIFDYQIISFQLFGSGITKYHHYGSWILSTSIPIGAILFLFKRSKYNKVDIVQEDNKENLSIGG